MHHSHARLLYLLFFAFHFFTSYSHFDTLRFISSTSTSEHLITTGPLPSASSMEIVAELSSVTLHRDDVLRFSHRALS